MPRASNLYQKERRVISARATRGIHPRKESRIRHIGDDMPTGVAYGGRVSPMDVEKRHEAFTIWAAHMLRVLRSVTHAFA